ncbi:zf-HC2 domain-containing protein [Nocardioides sp. MAHUQ-72]|uniref:zf-HC2 domain-containing protein n=1 Tax=unclassified Nocardioides TaxID=2615069 RepID=UPI003621A665
MSTHTWHLGEDRLEAYVAGGLDAVEGTSVEQHLVACVDCRARVGALVDAPALTMAWDGVRSAVERPAQPVFIRAARRLGLSEPAAVLLTASASLRTAWLTSSLVALAFAFLAARVAGDRIWPFLLVAPLVPVLGVAASYGPSTDALETLIVTSPYGRTRLILVRAAAVLTTCLPFSMLLSLLLPGPLWVAAAWLGPALAMIPVLLAIASFVGPRAAASVVAMGWSAVVLASTRHLAPTWPVDPDRQLVLLALAAVSVAVLVLRSRQTRQLGAAL